MIKRNIYEKLKIYIQKKEIIALIGSRQVGKTTLMDMLFEEIKKDKKRFISFDEPLVLNQFENNFEDFIKVYVENYDYLFIDEFQYAKEGGKKLKLLYDKYKIKIVISSSSAPELSIQSLGYLVGRVFIFEIFPLSFEEFLNYKSKDLINVFNKNINQKNIELFANLFEEFLIFGAYPQVVIETNLEEKKFALKSLVNNYLLKEIKDVLSYKNSYEFENLLKFLAITDSTLLNKSNISSDLGIHINKVSEMLNVLNKTYIINILNPHSNKKIKELIKSPKTYFFDLGFKNMLINNFNKLSLRVDRGAILENFIFSELTKKEVLTKFYNYKNSSEVDFLIEFKNKKIALEVKSNLSGLKIEKSLRIYIDKYNPDLVYIFNLNVEGELKINQTKVIFLHPLNISNIF